MKMTYGRGVEGCQSSVAGLWRRGTRRGSPFRL